MTIAATSQFFVLDSLASPQDAQPTGVAYRAVFGELDKFVEQYMRAMNSPGMTLVMADRDGVQRIATYGFSDAENKIAVRPDELFQIGSISKSFVANWLLELRQEGSWTSTSPSAEYLP